jgi:hypothetical protein
MVDALRVTSSNVAPTGKPAGERDVEPQPGAAAMAADHFKYGMMTTAAVQDSTRTASIVTRQAGHHFKALEHFTLFTNGEREAVGPVFRWLGSVSARSVASAGPKMSRLASNLGAFMHGSGVAFEILTKYCQIITLPFVAMDVVDAVREQEPRAKRAKTVNASISVVSGLTGIVGIFWWATPIGLPSLVVSIACGVFQLSDSLAFKGKATDWLAQQTLGRFAR